MEKLQGNCSVSMVHHYCQTFWQGDPGGGGGGGGAGGGVAQGGKGPLNETYGYLCGQLSCRVWFVL